MKKPLSFTVSVIFLLSIFPIAHKAFAGVIYSQHFNDIHGDGHGNIYTVGYEFDGDRNASIKKFNASLDEIKYKIYQRDGYESTFHGVFTDGKYIYAVGENNADHGHDGHERGYDALIVKFDSSLNILASKTYGGDASDYFRSVYSDGKHIYAVGETYSTTTYPIKSGYYSTFSEKQYTEGLIVKFDASLNMIKNSETKLNT